MEEFPVTYSHNFKNITVCPTTEKLIFNLINKELLTKNMRVIR